MNKRNILIEALEVLLDESNWEGAILVCESLGYKLIREGDSAWAKWYFVQPANSFEFQIEAMKLLLAQLKTETSETNIETSYARKRLAEMPASQGRTYCGIPLEQFSKDELLKILDESLLERDREQKVYRKSLSMFQR